MRGVHHDYTEGSMDRAIVLLAVPMVLEMFMESLFGLADVFWVARLGPDAITTVGLTETSLALVFVMAIGLSVGATAVVARRIGEKDEHGAGVAAIQAILMGVAVSIVVSILGFVFADDVLRTLGASPNVIRTGANYTRIILSGSLTVFLLFLINAVFRGAGDAAVAMRVLWLANLVNICLNPCLIFGWGPFPELGVAGSAVGTTIGRGVGVLYQLWILGSGSARIRVRFAQLRVDVDVLMTMLRLSSTAILQYLIHMASWVGVVRVISSISSNAVAANTLAIRLILFAILPSWGMSNAAATLVGQNLGAKRPDRAEQAVWRTGLFNMIFLGVIGIAFILFAEPIMHVFTDDPRVAPMAVQGLRMFALGNISYAYGMVVSAAFNGAGDTTTPTILNFICFWMAQIPLAYYLAIAQNWGPSGAWTAVLVGDTLLAVLAIAIFRMGRWKGVTV